MPTKVATKANVKQKPADDLNATDVTEIHDDFIPVLESRQLMKPENQLKLTDAELKEEITRVLTANNPHAPQNIIRWNFKENQFKPILNVDQTAILFSMDSNMIHVDSEEAKLQKLMQGDGDFEERASDSVRSAQSVHSSVSGQSVHSSVSGQSVRSSVSGQSVRSNESQVSRGDAEDAETKELNPSSSDVQVEPGSAGQSKEPSPEPSVAEVGEVGEVEEVVVVRKSGKEKKLTNQFNFNERAAQTYTNPLRDRSTMTEPPPSANYSANVTQWEIYDSYQEDFARQRTEKQKEKKVVAVKKEDDFKKKKMNLAGEPVIETLEVIAPAVKILERMVNQNTFDDISHDFMYYEDLSDEFRDGEGSLLPLWTFTIEKVKKMAITSLCWSSKYLDLFAVGHGSYGYQTQGGGVLLLYTLKNPSYPEYILDTESGIMSLDIHPDYPYLIVLGFFDGNVGVYNIVESKDSLAWRSSSNTGKHTDTVWQVRWQPEDLDGNLNFYSLSADGLVAVWTLVKNNLLYQEVIRLTMSDLVVEGIDGTQLVTLGSGTTFDFHPRKQHLFLVGTEEGKVHVCSKYHSSTFIDTYNAHRMAIYRIAWNQYHPKVFITCSDDWLIKIWDQTTSSKEPMFTFDLGSSVGDVAWAPYSSTTFAAVTADGKVLVYDLSVNKFEPLCEQIITSRRKTKLTHVAFNPKHPVVIVSDDRGTVVCLKLSPNLRKMPKAKKNQEVVKPEDKETIRKEREYQKLEKLLATVRQGGEKAARKPAAKVAKAPETKKE